MSVVSGVVNLTTFRMLNSGLHSGDNGSVTPWDASSGIPGDISIITSGQIQWSGLQVLGAGRKALPSKVIVNGLGAHSGFNNQYGTPLKVVAASFSGSSGISTSYSINTLYQTSISLSGAPYTISYITFCGDSQDPAGGSVGSGYNGALVMHGPASFLQYFSVDADQARGGMNPGEGRLYFNAGASSGIENPINPTDGWPVPPNISCTQLGQVFPTNQRSVRLSFDVDASQLTNVHTGPGPLPGFYIAKEYPNSGCVIAGGGGAQYGVADLYPGRPLQLLERAVGGIVHDDSAVVNGLYPPLAYLPLNLGSGGSYTLNGNAPPGGGGPGLIGVGAGAGQAGAVSYFNMNASFPAYFNYWYACVGSGNWWYTLLGPGTPLLSGGGWPPYLGVNGEFWDGAVATAKIADGAVTSGKLATDAISTDSFADDSITEAKIASGCISEWQVLANLFVGRSGISVTLDTGTGKIVIGRDS